MAISIVLGFFAGVTLVFMVWFYYVSGVRWYVGGQPMAPLVDVYAAAYLILMNGYTAILLQKAPPDFELSAAFLPPFLLGGVVAIWAATKMHWEQRIETDVR